MVRRNVELEGIAKQKFREMPQLKPPRAATTPVFTYFYPSVRVERCARETGHVLVVEGKKIRCIQCPAEWKDEGF